ncbi:MAG: helix-turn-helix transcriptional regulator [Streptosporangiaceae bacterium]
MDLAGVRRAVDALRKARDGDVFVLLDPGVVDVLVGVLPADAGTLHELDLHAQHCALVELLSTKAAEIHGAFRRHFWNTPRRSDTEKAGRLRGDATTAADFYGDRQWHSTGVYIECIAPYRVENQLVMPLPASPGTSRRLVFFRAPGRSFDDEERDAAMLLQPHIADALRVQGRRAADRLLTGRQRELLRLVAAGHDNVSIACQLGLSPATVRKHLENAFARLEVSSRTEAVAKVCPDAAWR